VADGLVAGQGTGEAQAEGTETARVVILLTTRRAASRSPTRAVAYYLAALDGRIRYLYDINNLYTEYLAS
jgi:hypothetical protein